MRNLEDLQRFSRNEDGSARSLGHTIVAWWLGNWVTYEKLHTQDQLQSLAAMIDAAIDRERADRA